MLYLFQILMKFICMGRIYDNAFPGVNPLPHENNQTRKFDKLWTTKYHTSPSR